MKTVTLDVRTPDTAMGDFVRVWNSGKPEKSDGRIVFPYEAVKVEFLLEVA